MRKRIIWLVMLIALAGRGFASEAITFADVGWDSIKLNNALAGFIAKNVYGYDWTEVPGSTPIIHEALMTGDVDVVMEEWTDNIPTYNADRDAGKFVELGINFNDNYQGFYIPRYVADANPGLKTVRDLKDYAFLFTDPEDPSKGRIFGGIPGWAITEIMEKKVTVYGLDGSYNYVVPGSNAALDAALVSAYDRKEPVVSYYWEPTWLLGSYDFVLLKDDPYDAECFPQGYGAAPSVTVTIAVSNAFATSHPDLCAFLSRYHLSSPLISEALAYMKDTGADHASTARWLLGEHPELLSSWLDGDDLAKAKAALEGNAVVEKKGWLDFPVTLPLNTAKVDQSVRNSASQSSAGGGQKFLSGLVGFFSWILSHLPWFVIILGVGVLGWRSQKSVVKGVVYALLVSVIGLLGLWSEMLTTLSIVLASVLLALVLGLPIGVLVSFSKRAERIVRPILDAMQTMPAFVYLIPALLFFGMGGPAAVIATVIYAIVPVIRLTCFGIQSVDPEVVEAAVAFGSTRWQTLWKVQIPQALPTIMTGVNQTLMMAMAMVVTCSMIGARGLGMEVLNAVNRIEIGRGLVAGSCVVIMAIVMDRITQGRKGEGK